MIKSMQVRIYRIYWIFETGLTFDNIFATVDLIDILHSGIIWFTIEIAQKNKSFHFVLGATPSNTSY